MATFGNDVDWSTGWSHTPIEDIIEGGVFEAPASGTLNSVKVYLYNPSTTYKAKAGVYEWNDPNWDLIASSSEITVPKDPPGGSNHLHTFTLGDENITSGKLYALCVWAEDKIFTIISICYDPSQPNPPERQFTGWYFDPAAYDGWPDPGEGSRVDDGDIAVAIFADYTPSVVGILSTKVGGSFGLTPINFKSGGAFAEKTMKVKVGGAFQ